MLNGSQYYWIEMNPGEWEPARYVSGDGDPHRFVTTNGIRMVAEVLLIGPPLIPPNEQDVTVRDQFAMSAMSGILSGMTAPGTDAAIADASYGVADAMMEARKKC